MTFNPPVDEDPADLVQRADDTKEVVEKRLRTYHEQTAPVLDYYKSQNKVSEIDGSQKRSEEHTSELQSRQYLVCRLLLEKKKEKHTSELQSRHYLVCRLLI